MRVFLRVTSRANLNAPFSNDVEEICHGMVEERHCGGFLRQ